jgi:uncharacterized protein
VRFEIRVKPKASANRVGGTWGEGVLIVAVTAPAVDGRANKAVVRALARSLELGPGRLSIVSGERHRTKVIEIADPPSDLTLSLNALRSARRPTSP